MEFRISGRPFELWGGLSGGIGGSYDSLSGFLYGRRKRLESENWQLVSACINTINIWLLGLLLKLARWSGYRGQLSAQWVSLDKNLNWSRYHFDLVHATTTELSELGTFFIFAAIHWYDRNTVKFTPWYRYIPCVPKEKSTVLVIMQMIWINIIQSSHRWRWWDYSIKPSAMIRSLLIHVVGCSQSCNARRSCIK